MKIDGSDPAAPYANEPSPNGSLRNLGYYGNTSEAATSQLGTPTLSDGDVVISFADDTVPTVAVTLGGADMYNANAKIELAKSYGGDAAESAWRFKGARLKLVDPPEFFDPPTNAVVLHVLHGL